MELFPTKIEGAFLLKPKVFEDSRGFFLETWSKKQFTQVGIDTDFVQDNQSRSVGNVLRGLHYQSAEHAQGKLVRVFCGAVYDVLVDLRKSSPTFGCWDGYVLDASSHEQLWVPPGCAHGFLVLSEFADFYYKVTRPYCQESERTLLWNDPSLNIAWPLTSSTPPILSARDEDGASFADCEKYE